MEPKETHYFTEKEEAAIGLLRELGLGKTDARVLVYLIANRGGATLQEIERGADLRQSEASIATASLLEKKWLSCYVAAGGSVYGRPVKVYRLGKPVPEIIGEIEEEKRADFCTCFKKMNELQYLVHEYYARSR